MVHLRYSRELLVAAVDVCLVICLGRPGFSQTAAPEKLLTAAGHNEVVKAAQDHYKALAQELDLKNRKKQAKPKPTDRETLEAMLKVTQIPSSTKMIVRAALGKLAALDQARQKRSPSVDRSLKEIHELLASAKTPRDVLQKVTERSQTVSKADPAGLAEGLRISQEILRSGMSTIYSPKNQFYRDIAGKQAGEAELDNEDVEDVAGADVEGAVSGAVDGAITGGQVLEGAVAEAIGSSAAEVAGKVWDWITD